MLRKRCEVGKKRDDGRRREIECGRQGRSCLRDTRLVVGGSHGSCCGEEPERARFNTFSVTKRPFITRDQKDRSDGSRCSRARRECLYLPFQGSGKQKVDPVTFVFLDLDNKFRQGRGLPIILGLDGLMESSAMSRSTVRSTRTCTLSFLITNLGTR